MQQAQHRGHEEEPGEARLDDNEQHDFGVDLERQGLREEQEDDLLHSRREGGRGDGDTHFFKAFLCAPAQPGRVDEGVGDVDHVLNFKTDGHDDNRKRNRRRR